MDMRRISSRPDRRATSGLLPGRRILIAGAATPVGQAAAKLCAGEGARLALLDRDEEALKRLSEHLDANAFPVDLGQEHAVRRAVDAAGQTLGGLDGLINCVAPAVRDRDDQSPSGVPPDLTGEMSRPYIVCRACVSWLKSEPGSTVVNVPGLIGGSTGAADLPMEAAVAGGLVAYSKALAAQLAPDVRVNSLCPPYVGIDAPPWRPGQPPGETVLWRFDLDAAAEPLNEIAAMVLLLSCRESLPLTGAAVALDGARVF